MLRKQTIVKIKYERYTVGLLKTMAGSSTLAPYHIYLNNNRLRSLSSEAYYFAKKWFQYGKVLWMSHDKLSFICNERRSNHEWHKHYSNIKWFLKHHPKAVGYILTVNPKRFCYRQSSSLNRKLYRDLERDPQTSVIVKELEDNFIDKYDDPHFHYLIISLHPLNRSKIERRAKRYGRDATNSKTQTKMTIVKNWRKAVSYVTKQYGLPLPLKHRILPNGSKSKLNQFQEFRRLPLRDQMQLLHNWIVYSKGINRHRIYYNPKCEPAKEFHQHVIKINKRIKDRRYCHRHNVLVNTSKLASKQSQTVFGVNDQQLINRLYPKAHKIISRHHLSEHEAMMQWTYGDIYHHVPKNYQQLTLVGS